MLKRTTLTALFAAFLLTLSAGAAHGFDTSDKSPAAPAPSAGAAPRVTGTRWT